MNRRDRHPLRFTRRDLLSSVLGGGALALSGCDSVASMWSGSLPGEGKMLSPNHGVGHRLRQPVSERCVTDDSAPMRVRCAIVGGGVAGLSAARQLKLSGLDDFVVLEMESSPGGTSRSTEFESPAFGNLRAPWGAHYLPMPKPTNVALTEFLTQCGVLRDDGQPTEQTLCRDPEERVLADGVWQAGLLPMNGASDSDRKQVERFRRLVTQWATRIGSDGRPCFTLPSSQCSNDEACRALDKVSMAEWLRDNELNSPRLLWLVDHSCRDDYGLRSDQTSAWAGLFYFAARLIDPTNSDESAAVLTWPEGNGFLIDQLVQSIGDRIQCGRAVMSIEPGDAKDGTGPITLSVLDIATSRASRVVADHVILAVPQFIASRLFSDAWGEAAAERKRLAGSFRYGSWLVANVVLRDRPAEGKSWMCWDNVRYQSSSLGYVNSGHQTGRDHGGTVLTWYQALTADDAAIKRGELMTLTWAEAAEVVCSDLESMHADIRPLIDRLDTMIWGHAMVQPMVGSMTDPNRVAAMQSIGNVHFAAADLSGLALFEEAFDHGRRAAMECML